MSRREKFFDILPPKPRHTHRQPAFYKVPIDVPYVPVEVRGDSRPKTRWYIPLAATTATFLVVLGFFGFSLWQFKDRAEQAGPAVYDNFKAGAAALFNFDVDKAKGFFQQASDDLATLNESAPLKTVPAVLNNLFQISQSAVSLSTELEDLKKNAVALMVNKKGAFLLQKLHKIQELLKSVNILGGQLNKQAAGLGYNADTEFGKLNSNLGEADLFLTAFLRWAEAPKKQRLLILFQNPSEIRPAGGFLGSYGIATLFQGNLLELETQDIYDPDGQLDLKLIPPKPLRSVTEKWGARDANWFFDYPASAKKVIELLEASKIYSERGIRFSGAIAVNVELIEDLLEIIGPVELPEYNLTVTRENFLKEVQREVEEGADKVKNNPKKILKTLTPMIFAELAKLDEVRKHAVLEAFGKRFRNKDLMVYFKDPAVESYAAELGVGGEVMGLPENFTGEYLAVVNANIAGGKSDAFIRQKINFVSSIAADGSIKSSVSVERRHTGDGQKDWWYRATNRDYLQIYATPGSEIKKIRGATERVVKPAVDYVKENYATDRDLAALEASDLAFGKKVFASWLHVKAGDLGKIIFEYERKNALDLSEATIPYQFVFEKQSGQESELSVILYAPEGFEWQESKSEKYEYTAKDLPARIVLNLNLSAISR